MAKPIKVLVVDDSPMIQMLFTHILDKDPDIQVVGTAGDPYEAREKMHSLHPDVMTLDIDMPKMDGLTFLQKVISYNPIPVVMASFLTQEDAEPTIRALEIGAVDFIPKTDLESFDSDHYAGLLCEKIKIAARVSMEHMSNRETTPAMLSGENIQPGKISLIAIGSSIGGLGAMMHVVPYLPANTPPVLLIQSIPEQFTQQYIERLNHKSLVEVCLLEDGKQLLPGHAYIIPDNRTVTFQQGSDATITAKVTKAATITTNPVNNVLEAIAIHTDRKAIGVLMTGSKEMHTKGMKAFRNAGGYLIGQEKNGCLIPELAASAQSEGLLHIVRPLDNIAEAIITQCSSLSGSDT